MKKATKTIGAVALSAALALGTAVPAFAAPTAADRPNGETSVTDEVATGTPAVETQGQFEYKAETEGADKVNTGSTKVRVMSDVTQLSATVPVMVYVVADVMGGELLGAPTGTGALTAKAAEDGSGTISYSGYRIENNTNRPIYVTDVKASTDDQSGQWKYEDGKIDGGYSDLKGAARGRIHLTLNPYETAADYTTALAKSAANATALVTAATAAGADDAAKAKVCAAKGAEDVTAAGGATYNWAIPAFTYSTETGHESAFTPGVLGLEIRGTTSMIKNGTIIQYGNSSADSSAGTAAFDDATYKKDATDVGDVKLVYTIGATAKTVSSE